jgi:hypothetical protein
LQVIFVNPFQEKKYLQSYILKHKFMRITLFTIFLLALAACGGDSEKNNAGRTTQAPVQLQDWHAATKGKILADYQLGTDSTAETPIENGRFLEINQYRQGKLKVKKITTLNKQTMYETIYAGGFELRREYCGNEVVSFEGINRNGEFFGLSTWWHCNTGKMQKQGLKYRSKLFGKWSWWQEDGTLDKEENYGLMNYLDSLNTIGWME